MASAGGAVQYRLKGNNDFAVADADRSDLYIPELTEQPITAHYLAVLDNLTADSVYEYRVGDPHTRNWSGYREFKTAPDGDVPFTFAFLGDIQGSCDLFGNLIKKTEIRHSNISFYLLAGDLVNDGENRNEWDAMLAASNGVFALKPVIAAIGNHDYRYMDAAGSVTVFGEYFRRPASDAASPYAHSFAYGNVFFIVLDSLADMEAQTPWLEEQLQKADRGFYAWKVVMFHHPVYSTHIKRLNDSTRYALEHWTPLFESYGVDLVLSGHDHSYMRTPLLREGRAAGANENGVVYVMANASEKFYPSKPVELAAVQVSETPSYQIISSGRNTGGRFTLMFTAYDIKGGVLDAFVLVK